MYGWSILLFVVCCAWLSSAQPIDASEAESRAKRSPSHAMMIHGHFRRTPNGYHYSPQAGMTAFASGNAVAAGSYYNSRSQRPNCGPCDQPENNEHEAPEEAPEEEKPAEEEVPEPEAAAEVPEDQSQEEENEVTSIRTPKAPEAPKATKAPKAPKATTKPPKRRPADSDESDNGQGGTFSNFFPMSFGSNPSGNTAIANSFSVGTRAIANSHATAYGSGPPAAPAAAPDSERLSSIRRNKSSRYSS